MFRASWLRAGIAGLLGAALVTGAGGYLATVVHAQQTFELFLAAISEKTHQPALDLTATDIGMTENGQPGRIVRLERYTLPVKLTILIDNSSDNSGAASELVHFRNGLRGLIEALPADLETSVISMAPTPRFLARPTTDRVELLRSVQLLIPEPEILPRFSDALVEYSARLERDFRGEAAEAPPYMPILVAVTTTRPDGSESRRDDMKDMLERLAKYGVRTHFAVVSRRADNPGLELAEGSQIFVAQALQELTNGQYDSIAASSRVATLLPEWGQQIAMTHRAGTNQYRVTLERPSGASGPIKQLSMFVNREGYYGVVTADGRVP